MIDVDVVLVNMDEQTAYCSDGVTRDFFEMYDAEAQPTEDPDLAIAAVVKVGDDQYILLNLTGERSPGSLTLRTSRFAARADQKDNAQPSRAGR